MADVRVTILQDEQTWHRNIGAIVVSGYRFLRGYYGMQRTKISIRTSKGILLMGLSAGDSDVDGIFLVDGF